MKARSLPEISIDRRKATDRIFCFLIMIALGKYERTSMEAAVERYAEGAAAAVRDQQRVIKKQREEWHALLGYPRSVNLGGKRPRNHYAI
jgi:hypothetical protein